MKEKTDVLAGTLGVLGPPHGYGMMAAILGRFFVVKADDLK